MAAHMAETCFTSGTHNRELSICVRYPLHTHWSHKERVGQTPPWPSQTEQTVLQYIHRKQSQGYSRTP